MIHKMNLNPEPFEMIRNDQKTIELRLNDEKRRMINVGDMIEFTQTETGENLPAPEFPHHVFRRHHGAGRTGAGVQGAE